MAKHKLNGSTGEEDDGAARLRALVLIWNECVAIRERCKARGVQADLGTIPSLACMGINRIGEFARLNGKNLPIPDSYFCLHCGPKVNIDEEGRCVHCGGETEPRYRGKSLLREERHVR